MTTLKVSPLLLLAPVLVFINSARAAGLDIPPNIPQEFKEFGALSDEVLKAKLVDQINGRGKEAANAANSDATTGAVANAATLLNSATAPDGKGKLNKIMEQLNGPAPQADALKAAGKDNPMLANLFEFAPGPVGAAHAAAADVLSNIFKRGPPPTTAESQNQEAPPPKSSGSPAHVPSSILGIGMMTGLVSFFAAF